MTKKYVIEDEDHAEIIGEYKTYKEALEKLKELKVTPWGTEPNLPPCSEGINCCREYILIEYEDLDNGLKELSKSLAMKIDKNGVEWFLKD